MKIDMPSMRVWEGCRHVRPVRQDNPDRRGAILLSRVPDRRRANDILFVDSSHVSNVGSDVNHILFQLLPRLKSGVLVHFHDVLYPFEYHMKWFELRRSDSSAQSSV